MCAASRGRCVRGDLPTGTLQFPFWLPVKHESCVAIEAAAGLSVV